MYKNVYKDMIYNAQFGNHNFKLYQKLKLAHFIIITNVYLIYTLLIKWYLTLLH